MSEAPRRRQAEPIGASGQLPPRPQASLLLLLKDPPERVYVEPCKLPAPDFAISQEIRTCACKRGLGAAGPTKRISELSRGGGGSEETSLFEFRSESGVCVIEGDRNGSSCGTMGYVSGVRTGCKFVCLSW